MTRPAPLLDLEAYRRIRGLDRWAELPSQALAIAFVCPECGTRRWRLCPNETYDPCEERFLRASRARNEWWGVRTRAGDPAARRRFSAEVVRATERTALGKAFARDALALTSSPKDFLRHLGFALVEVGSDGGAA